VSPNRILAGLPREDFALLEPHLEPVDLPVRRRLETSKRRIDQVYFIEAGFASVVANGSNKPSIEVGIIGREGMTGLAVLLGGERAPHDSYIQVAGKGQRISAANLRQADERCPTLHRAMLRYANQFLLQTTTTALANGRSRMEERLARWLLMAADRVGGKELPLTHEFLPLTLQSMTRARCGMLRRTAHRSLQRTGGRISAFCSVLTYSRRRLGAPFHSASGVFTVRRLPKDNAP
jgi:CRP-like cAMP-binding protein